MEKPDLSLYHLNLLHLQMDVVLFDFEFFKEKRNKLDYFITLTHVKIAREFVIIFHKLSVLMSHPIFEHVIKSIFESSHHQIE